MNEIQKTKWGEPRIYKTDDADMCENQLKILQGGNGDWYVVVRYIAPSGYWAEEAVRVTTSGQQIEGFDAAVAKAYRALGGETLEWDRDLTRMQVVTVEICKALGIDFESHEREISWGERMLKACLDVILSQSKGR